MARLLTTGFEVGIPGNNSVLARQLDGQDGSGNTAVALDTGTKRSGASSCKCAGNMTVSSMWNHTFLANPADGDTRYFRVYFNVDALPAGATRRIMQLRQGTTNLVTVRMTTAGKLQLFDDIAASQVGSDSVATVATGTWYRLELSYTFSASGNDSFEARLDGVTIASTSSANSATAPTNIRIGWVDVAGQVANMYLDDFAMNDQTGSAQTSWPGEGKIVWLAPISDSARDTLWTAGAGGTTNLFDAVNNAPPAGLAAASETNTSQIKHAGGAAGTTDRYDANLTTYTTAGLAATDTIVLVQALVNAGEEVTTGAKLLSFEILSNPVVPTTGSFDVSVASTAIGTWPSSWFTKYGTIVYAPISVTLGTSPVMRVIRPETATRVAGVNAMGMYVEYIPSLPPGAGPNPTEVVGALSTELAAMLHQGR